DPAQRLARLLVLRVLAAERAELLVLDPVRVQALVLGARVVAVLAVPAGERDDVAHFVPCPSLRALGCSRYATSSATTPAPTVRPPSRMAKRSSFSIAMGVISSISIVTLSPGMTISRPCGSFATPVTSVVRK